VPIDADCAQEPSPSRSLRHEENSLFSYSWPNDSRKRLDNQVVKRNGNVTFPAREVLDAQRIVAGKNAGYAGNTGQTRRLPIRMTIASLIANQTLCIEA